MHASYISESDEFSDMPLPLYLERVAAGFPSPAQDYAEQTLERLTEGEVMSEQAEICKSMITI